MKKDQEKIREVNYVVISTQRIGSNGLFNVFKNNQLVSLRNIVRKTTELFGLKILSKLKYKDLDLRQYINSIFSQYAVISDDEKISGSKIFINQRKKYRKL